MTTETKQGGPRAATPCLAGLCAGLMRRDLAPGAPWLSTLPVLLGAVLALLLASGMALAVFYDPRAAQASLRFIALEVPAGWIMRGYHVTGAGLGFVLLYVHLFRMLLTRGYRGPAAAGWMLWVTLLAALLLAGWLGFALNGGLGGYWSLINAISASLALSGPAGGVAMWFFGGAPGDGTLARLLVFHAVLGVAAAGLLWLACAATRQARPAPAGRMVAFWPVYAAQAFAALALLALVFALLMCFAPHWGQGAQSQLPASSLAVPAAVSYPWYLTPLAGLTALFPGAGGHALAVIAAAAALYALPWLDRSGGGAPGGLYRALTWLLGLDVLGLGVSAVCPVAAGLQILLFVWFFIHFLVLTPAVTAMEAA